MVSIMSKNWKLAKRENSIMRFSMTEKEFMQKYDLDSKDIDYIADMISMRNSLSDIANSMSIDIEDLQEFWGDE